ncbi:MAG: hypothetical protein EON54_02565 [Alcaligenaceae bacterium]|nr:MAG: hypothetical protein EON54_02565 [Alcaligenaceae bacterium]
MGTDRDLENLSDVALATLAKDTRRQAWHGDRSAFGQAHALEKELRRRGLAEEVQTALQPLREDTVLAVLPPPRRHVWWRFWRRRS